ncbi:MAG: hypothetical protein A3A51_02460 [Candidatus Levybacteria bacterium RIFCSPLOWO2_01_FULL_39_10]|nr:MAG: hypothetical protein A3A51_02460 [Candidatus Levybacteria bacterium RIFCSPLOWO2_01_FULL_39_10]
MPEGPGVYIFLEGGREVIYVGKAVNLRKRVSSYFTKKEQDPKTKILVSLVSFIKTITVESELESLILEANLIKKYAPKYNMRLTDGKSYIRIKITVKDKNPKVLLARAEDDGKSLYFSPYPTSSDVKLVLKLIRKIFPYQSVLNHPKRYCLYYHLGLCPCPPMFKTDLESKSYRKDIKRITKFLEGKSKALIRDLEKERDIESKRENFEKAQKLQKKITAINSVTQNYYSPYEYEMNPDLVKLIRKNQLIMLKSVLNNSGVGVYDLARIECFDISNISGKYATGSMVVFKNGEKDKPSYRRFKIKNPPKTVPNDFAMMQEVIRRRLNHPEWQTPDLIIVDGGKGQVSSSLKVLNEANVQIPLVGIAKREEIIIASDLKEIKIDKNSPALLLVRRIRDEAHRFAITYHRKLRSKYLLN